MHDKICGSHFEHVFFKHEVCAPTVLHVLLECRTEGTEVEKACNTAVNFKRGHDKELALEEVFDFASFVLGC